MKQALLNRINNYVYKGSKKEELEKLFNMASGWIYSKPYDKEIKDHIYNCINSMLVPIDSKTNNLNLKELNENMDALADIMLNYNIQIGKTIGKYVTYFNKEDKTNGIDIDLENENEIFPTKRSINEFKAYKLAHCFGIFSMRESFFSIVKSCSDYAANYKLNGKCFNPYDYLIKMMDYKKALLSEKDEEFATTEEDIVNTDSENYMNRPEIGLNINELNAATNHNFLMAVIDANKRFEKELFLIDKNNNGDSLITNILSSAHTELGNFVNNKEDSKNTIILLNEIGKLSEYMDKNFNSLMHINSKSFKYMNNSFKAASKLGTLLTTVTKENNDLIPSNYSLEIDNCFSKLIGATSKYIYSHAKKTKHPIDKGRFNTAVTALNIINDSAALIMQTEVNEIRSDANLDILDFSMLNIKLSTSLATNYKGLECAKKIESITKMNKIDAKKEKLTFNLNPDLDNLTNNNNYRHPERTSISGKNKNYSNKVTVNSIAI